MALPNSQSTHRSTNSDNPKPQSQSYANALKGNIKQSLLHSVSETSHSDDESYTTIRSRIFRSSRTPGAFLFDISHCFPHFTEKQVMLISKEQHPNSHSCVASKDGNKRYLEIYVDKEDDDNNIAESGLIFDKIKLRLLPCISVQDASKVVNVKLTNLPLMKKDKVLQGLKASLAPFGTLLDVGIFVDQATKYFMGNGYAVLDVCNSAPDSKYHSLTHVINWNESQDDAFHATWNNMPTWCRYCHEQEHTKYECALSKAKIICYACHQHGHRSFECPRKAITPKSFKKPRKERLIYEGAKDNNRISNHQPSAELLKSKHAPVPSASDSSNISIRQASQVTVSQISKSPQSIEEDEDSDDSEYLPTASDDEDDRSDTMSVDAKINSSKIEDEDDLMAEIDNLVYDQQRELEFVPTMPSTSSKSNTSNSQLLPPGMKAADFFSPFSSPVSSQVPLSDTTQFNMSSSHKVLSDDDTAESSGKTLQ